MRITAHAVFLSVNCTAFAITPAPTQNTIDVTGLDGKSAVVDLSGLKRHTGVTFGDALKGPALSRVVMASARDGYRVVYAIAELDAGFTDQIVLLADRRGGKPLLSDTGPLQIIVPNDKRAARWIRQVNKIEVRELK